MCINSIASIPFQVCFYVGIDGSNQLIQKPRSFNNLSKEFVLQERFINTLPCTHIVFDGLIWKFGTHQLKIDSGYKVAIGGHVWFYFESGNILRDPPKLGIDIINFFIVKP